MLAGLFFAAAAGALCLLALYLVSGTGHPAFVRLPYRVRHSLGILLPLAVLIPALLGIGLIALWRWAWAGTSLIAAVAFALALVPLPHVYRSWHAAPGVAEAGTALLIQGSWAFVTGVIFLYLGFFDVLNAFRIQHRLLARVICWSVLAVLIGSGYGVGAHLEGAALASVEWVRGMVAH